MILDPTTVLLLPDTLAFREVRAAYLTTLAQCLAADFPVLSAIDVAERAWDAAVSRQREEALTRRHSSAPPD